MAKHNLGPRQSNKRGNENFTGGHIVDRWKATGRDQVTGARDSVSDLEVGQARLMEKGYGADSSEEESPIRSADSVTENE